MVGNMVEVGAKGARKYSVASTWLLSFRTCSLLSYHNQIHPLDRTTVSLVVRTELANMCSK